MAKNVCGTALRVSAHKIAAIFRKVGVNLQKNLKRKGTRPYRFPKICLLASFLWVEFVYFPNQITV
jgi:hypothetical protein